MAVEADQRPVADRRQSAGGARDGQPGREEQDDGFAPYRVDPSGEYAIWPTRARAPFTLGIEKLVAAPSVPSALTANRVRASCCGSQRNLVGPS